MPICKDCQVEGEDNDFFPKPKENQKLKVRRCETCYKKLKNEQAKRHREKDPQGYKEKQKKSRLKYWSKNKDQINAKQKEFRDNTSLNSF